MSRYCILIIISAFFLPADANAQDSQPRGRTLTKQQFLRNADRAFDRLDLNKDGVIDQAEQKAAIDEAVRKLRERLERNYAETDANKDGKLTREEFRARRTDLFEKLDADHDGLVTPAERQKFFQRRPPSATPN